MLSKETAIKGIWWLESNPDKRLQGEIKYGPTSGAEVDVFGQFYDSFDDKRLREQFTLHGLSFKAKPITLFRSLMTGCQMYLPGGIRQRPNTRRQLGKSRRWFIAMKPNPMVSVSFT
jgi:hypothetical protein